MTTTWTITDLTAEDAKAWRRGVFCPACERSTPNLCWTCYAEDQNSHGLRP